MDMTAPLGDRLLDAIKRNPEGLLFLAAGAALLMRRHMNGASAEDDAPDRRAGRRRTATKARWQQEVSETAETVRDYAAETADTVRDYATSATASVSQSATRLASDASRYSKKLRRKAGRSAGKFVREQPIGVALAGLAAGAALATLFPRLELEERTLAPVGQRLSEVARSAGERFKEATQEASERLVQAIDERGRDGLAEVATEVAGAFGSAVARGSPAQKRSGGTTDMDGA